jgi:RNA polymerase sigma-70 factor (ECF subfamily)
MLPTSMDERPSVPVTSPADPDRPLVERAQAGDTRAFGELVERYQGRVFALTRRILKDDDEAEDALQETFLSAFRGLKNFKQEARFSTWIFRVASNAALMRLRKKRHDTVSLERPSEDEDGPALELVDWGKTPEEELLDRETKDVMDKAIAELPADYAAVFQLRDVEGLSNEDAAEALGTTVAATKSRLHRARLFLRERLNRHFAGRGPRGTARSLPRSS